MSNWTKQLFNWSKFGRLVTVLVDSSCTHVQLNWTIVQLIWVLSTNDLIFWNLVGIKLNCCSINQIFYRTIIPFIIIELDTCPTKWKVVKLNGVSLARNPILLSRVGHMLSSPILNISQLPKMNSTKRASNQNVQKVEQCWRAHVQQN